MGCETKKAERLIHGVVDRMVKKEYYGWPPECGFLVYQPKRPAKATSMRPRSAYTKKYE